MQPVTNKTPSGCRQSPSSTTTIPSLLSTANLLGEHVIGKAED